ncbi:hypothetical protein AB1Y20_008621 [Prymnesium parvum]|uniref:Nucleolar protein 16 n=1 Tax=Prymnesium parvum TaxID=97485 RepID=A0AB34IV17_PRYPA
MPRAKTRPKQRRGIVKVRVKPQRKKAGAAQGLQASQITYDPSQTQFANYKAAGLLADSNQIGRSTDKNRVTGYTPRVKGPSAELSHDPSIQHPLELEMPLGEKTIRKVPPGECAVLRKLLDKHGEDYTAMSRDTRINTHQHTASHLRKRIQKMIQEDEQEAAAVTAAKHAGERIPRLRGERKISKLPNKAFKRSSTNFT